MIKQKALIIGGAGFVGGHLIRFLCEQIKLDVYVTKLFNEKIEEEYIHAENIYNLDITNKEQVLCLLEEIKPDYIFHLAAQSSVFLSWKEPALTFNINVIGTIHVLEAVKSLGLNSKLLLIGSAEQYGQIKQEDLPISESLPVNPGNPYAVSKASQEMIASMYVKSYGMDIVMVRAFNHIGPGQSPVFVISDFAKQVAEIEKGLREPVIYVGNLEAKRDFTDVRDIIRGYWMLMEKGNRGEVYNIGSGKSFEIKDMLISLINLSLANISYEVDPAKFRPTDILDIRADISKIHSTTGWEPRYTLKQTLMDVLNFWRKCV